MMHDFERKDFFAFLFFNKKYWNDFFFFVLHIKNK